MDLRGRMAGIFGPEMERKWTGKREFDLDLIKITQDMHIIQHQDGFEFLLNDYFNCMVKRTWKNLFPHMLVAKPITIKTVISSTIKSEIFHFREFRLELRRMF